MLTKMFERNQCFFEFETNSPALNKAVPNDSLLGCSLIRISKVKAEFSKSLEM